MNSSPAEKRQFIRIIWCDELTVHFSSKPIECVKFVKRPFVWINRSPKSTVWWIKRSWMYYMLSVLFCRQRWHGTISWMWSTFSQLGCINLHIHVRLPIRLVPGKTVRSFGWSKRITSTGGYWPQGHPAQNQRWKRFKALDEWTEAVNELHRETVSSSLCQERKIITNTVHGLYRVTRLVLNMLPIPSD